MNSLVSTVTLPARLVVRLLDDIHAVATAAATLSTRFDDIFELLDRKDELIDMAMRLDSSAAQIVEIGDAVVNVAGAVHMQVEEVTVHLPTFARAVKLTNPLSDGVDAVGRVLGNVGMPRPFGGGGRPKAELAPAP